MNFLYYLMNQSIGSAMTSFGLQSEANNMH